MPRCGHRSTLSPPPPPSPVSIIVAGVHVAAAAALLLCENTDWLGRRGVRRRHRRGVDAGEIEIGTGARDGPGTRERIGGGL